MLLPNELLKRRVFVAGGFAVYCHSMLYAVNIAERLHKKFRHAEIDCPLFGDIEFRNESFYWVRFPFLRHPGFYKPGQNKPAAGDLFRST
jgi:hypothetical protein